MKCKFCNAENNPEDKRCFSCDAPLPKRSELSEKDFNSLSNYISSVEKMLSTAKNKANGVIFIFFFLISAAWIAASIWGYLKFTDDRVMIIIVAIIIGFVLFITFGAIVQLFESKAIKKKYDEKIKDDIEEYIQEMNFKKIDFKIVASEILKEKSPLLKFLDDF